MFTIIHSSESTSQTICIWNCDEHQTLKRVIGECFHFTVTRESEFSNREICIKRTRSEGGKRLQNAY